MKFDDVYDKYFHDVYLYIYRMSGNRDIAEEVTSETFFKALKKIDSFRGDCSIKSWLCTIGKNCYFDYIKKHKREQTLDDNIALYEAKTDPLTSAVDKDDAARIKRLLHDLPETSKEVFMWRVFAEMSFEDIGALFGKSANWACVTYYRARKRIAEKMEEQK